MNRLVSMVAGGLLSAALLGGASPAQAAGIDYSLSALGDDVWRYEYTLDTSGAAFDFDAFTVYFDLPGTVEILGFSAPESWDGLVIQPDPALPDAGFFDVLSLAGLIAADSRISGFSVEFRQAAGSLPGSQRFELLSSDSFEVVYSGVTAPVPEPASAAMLLGGLSVVVLVARGRRRHAVDRAGERT